MKIFDKSNFITYDLVVPQSLGGREAEEPAEKRYKRKKGADASTRANASLMRTRRKAGPGTQLSRSKQIKLVKIDALKRKEEEFR